MKTEIKLISCRNNLRRKYKMGNKKMTVEEFDLKAQKLKILKKQGMITQDEFEEIKKKLIEELNFLGGNVND